MLTALEDAPVNANTVLTIVHATRNAAVESSPFFGVFDVQVTVAVIRSSTVYLEGTNRSDLKTILPLSVQTLSALFSALPDVLNEGFAEATGGSNSSAPLCLVSKQAMACQLALNACLQ